MAGYSSYKTTLPTIAGNYLQQQTLFNRGGGSVGSLRGRGGFYNGRLNQNMNHYMPKRSNYKDMCPAPYPASVFQTGYSNRGFGRGGTKATRGSFQNIGPQHGQETQEPLPSENMSDETNDDAACKMFVGGLDWELTADHIHEYFETFGPVLEVKLKTDIYTGQSRGFAFLKFQNPESVDKAMEQKTHKIMGKRVDPKRAVVNEEGICFKKVFVGGLDPNMSEEFIVEAFSEYGKVVLVELPVDRHTNQRRSFGFVLFESEESVNLLCQKSKVKLGDKLVDLRKIQSKDELKVKYDRTFGPAAVPFNGRKRGVLGYNYSTGFEGCDMYNTPYDYYDHQNTTYAANPSFGYEVPTHYTQEFRTGPNACMKNPRAYHLYSR